MDSCDENIVRLKFLAGQLVTFADTAVQESRDDRCFLLYGLTRDYGYRILAEAEREWKNHAEKKLDPGERYSGEEGE